jgi:CRISPR-associated endonuclease/helicase Cas3
MITVNLTGQQEKIAPVNPWNLNPRPLYHQFRTFEALQEPNTHLVVNSYNTGTGKTRAALLHLFALNGRKKDVLLIAPTNALLNQHAEDVADFVQEQGLDFKVVPVTAAAVHDLSQQLVAQGDYQQMRSGETLDRLIRNYREFFPEEQERQGLVLVVNPDIFYYALTFQYGSHDQRNLFHKFLTAFSYIIIDEFHYYDQKQLAFFLFFFAISRKMDYFTQRGHKICLLSATPNPRVTDYLNRLFAGNWQHITPHNEPAASDTYETVSTLTPLTLTLYSDDLVEWGKANGRRLEQWINQDKLDGAIISDALRRVNQLYAQLRFSPQQMGRITGPEPEEERQRATGRPLILATPTVDIGYNFKKLGKQRQNIDFLICEARFGDDLIQRIGRAGRILGKPETNNPSQAVALLKGEALDALRLYDGQTFNRAEFRAIVLQHGDCLPPKHNLYSYIRSWAITEIFYPIYRTRHLVRAETRDELEELYQEIRELFGVRSGTSRSLAYYFSRYDDRKRWLKATANKPIPYNRDTAQHVCDWFKFRGETEEYTPKDIQPYLDNENVLGTSLQQATLREFVAGQFHLTKSLFNFRDSFQGPTAVVYDPQNLLSSQEINAYDLFHIIEGYEVDWLDNRAEFTRLQGDTELEGALYGRLRQHRRPFLSLELRYRTDETQADFSRQWEGRPVALKGFQLCARERQGDMVPIDVRIREALAEKYVTTLLVAPDMVGWAIRALKNSPIYGRKLIIDFSDRKNVEYTAYLGRAAWFAHPELQFAYKIRDRMKSEAIIL